MKIMLDRDFFAAIKGELSAYESARREIIKLSSDAIAAAKRAIFALHRDDAAAAAKLLGEADAAFEKIRAAIKLQPDLAAEGSYRAALEEYVEAQLYRQYLAEGTVGKVAGEHIDYDIYIGGLTDLTGEMQRRQVRLATEGRTEEVRKIKELMESIVAELLEMDLGGYLRNKFDQAKNNLRRAEEVLYELTLRGK
jgi:predicted translin family RNA/ssDNA-binding protein